MRGTCNIIPSCLPTSQEEKSAPYNDTAVAVIARVTRETIEHHASQGKIIKDIDATAKAVAIESVQYLCVPFKTVSNTSKPQSVVTAFDANISNIHIHFLRRIHLRQASQEPFTLPKLMCQS